MRRLRHRTISRIEWASGVHPVHGMRRREESRVGLHEHCRYGSLFELRRRPVPSTTNLHGHVLHQLRRGGLSGHAGTDAMLAVRAVQRGLENRVALHEIFEHGCLFTLRRRPVSTGADAVGHFVHQLWHREIRSFAVERSRIRLHPV